MKVRGRGGGCQVEMPSLAVLAYALLASAFVPSGARADACLIETSGEHAAAWSAAREQLAPLALTELECTRVRIEFAGEQARVLFVTPDGRSAERIVTEPSELLPTIDALRVQAPVSAETEPAPAPGPAPSAQPARATPARPPPAEEKDYSVALLAGFRGEPATLGSPLLMSEIAFFAGVLDLGASLAAEVQYFDMSGEDPGRQGSTAAFSVHAGLRQPSGNVALRAGGRVTVAALLTVNSDTQACPVGVTCMFEEPDERTSEWRFGAYAGIVVPRATVLRLRADLVADLVAPAAPDAALAMTPPWALTALLGLEVAP